MWPYETYRPKFLIFIGKSYKCMIKNKANWEWDTDKQKKANRQGKETNIAILSIEKKIFVVSDILYKTIGPS